MSTQDLEFNIGEYLNDLVATTTKEAKVYASKSENANKMSRNRGGGGRRANPRKPGTDTHLTRGLVYQVEDETAETVWICVGIGAAEKKVAELLEAGHALSRATTNEDGEKLHPRNQDYKRCILTEHGTKRVIYWKPGKRFRKAEIYYGDNPRSYEWLRITRLADKERTIVIYRLTKVNEDTEERNLDSATDGEKHLEVAEAVAPESPIRGEVLRHLNVEPHELLSVMERVLDVTITEDEKRRLREMLLSRNRHTPPPKYGTVKAPLQDSDKLFEVRCASSEQIFILNSEGLARSLSMTLQRHKHRVIYWTGHRYSLFHLITEDSKTFDFEGWIEDHQDDFRNTPNCLDWRFVDLRNVEVPRYGEERGYEINTNELTKW